MDILLVHIQTANAFFSEYHVISTGKVHTVPSGINGKIH